jgi:uncharacterized protein involved in response to NO
MSTASAMRAYKGPALFSFGFRPFFLFGSLWGALAAPLWVYVLAHGGQFSERIGLDWHIHEMLFGYVGAIVGGFLLTAVPNWTGRYPVIGVRLAGLFALWAAGRAVMLFPGLDRLLVAAVDGAYLLALSTVIWREVVAGRNWRNLVVALAVTGLAGSNIAFHLRPEAVGLDLALRTGFAVVVVLLGLIGGRVTPSFTRNWLARQKPGSLPAAASRFDALVIGVTVVALAGWILKPDLTGVGLALMAAGALHLLRLARWTGWRTASQPLVWILHLGYAWLGVGLVLLGLTAAGAPFAPSAGLHALTVGAMGVMILAVTTRAARGHTGRDLSADAGTLVLYLLINAAALVRVAGGLWPDFHGLALILSSGLWAAALLGFAALYGPMLSQPRLRT